MHIKYHAVSFHSSRPGSLFAKWSGQTIKCDLEGPFLHRRPMVLYHYSEQLEPLQGDDLRKHPALLARKKEPYKGLRAYTHQFLFYPDKQLTSVGWPAF